MIALMVLQGGHNPMGMTGTDNCKIFKRADWSIIAGLKNQEEKVSEMNLKEQIGDKDAEAENTGAHVKGICIVLRHKRGFQSIHLYIQFVAFSLT